MQVLVYDTSIASSNIGDEIIMDAVQSELVEIFPNDQLIRTTTHDVIGRATYKIANSTDYSFVGGTNLLSSNMNWYNQWKINLIDSFYIKNVLLMGVGWWQYQSRPNLYTRFLLNNVLDKTIFHSVRDEYTANKLRDIGIDNVINTGCPTMWRLTANHCSQINAARSSAVVFTLTDYNKNIKLDAHLIKTLTENYEKIYFWPQGVGDTSYLRQFNISSIEILPSNLKSFDTLLSTHHSIEYVGTRLHAGIRALQHKRRSVIVAIDNRAIEISRDTNLCVLDRDSIDELGCIINSKFVTNININFDRIKLWREQFSIANSK